MTTTEAAYYLAAMIDGEGCVTRPPFGNGSYGRRSGNRSVTITNTDAQILNATKRCLMMLGIEYRVYETNPGVPRRMRSDIRITGRKNLERVYELVPLKCRRKLFRLAGCIHSYRNYNWRKNLPGRGRPRRIPED